MDLRKGKTRKRNTSWSAGYSLQLQPVIERLCLSFLIRTMGTEAPPLPRVLGGYHEDRIKCV